MNLGMYPVTGFAGESSQMVSDLTGKGANPTGEIEKDSMFQNLMTQMMGQMTASGGCGPNGKLTGAADLVSGGGELLTENGQPLEYNVLASLFFSNGKGSDAISGIGEDGSDPKKVAEKECQQEDCSVDFKEASALLAGLVQGMTDNPGLETAQDSKSLAGEQFGQSMDAIGTMKGQTFDYLEQVHADAGGNQPDLTVEGMEAFQRLKGEFALQNDDNSLKGMKLMGEKSSVEGIGEITDGKALSAEAGINGKQKELAQEADPLILSNNNSDYQNQIQGTANNDGTSAEPQIQSAEKLEAGSQVGREILSKLEQKGPMEFKMQLQPEDLGQIDIKLKLNDGKLMIDIMAASARTHELLAGQVDKLIASIGLSNVKVENVQISQQMNSQSQDSFNQSFTMNSGLNDSQKRQQEQFQEQIKRQTTSSYLQNLKIAEAEGIGIADHIQMMRDYSRRLDYVV